MRFYTIVCFLIVFALTQTLTAATRDELAQGLEKRLKSATCSPGLHAEEPIPSYRECGGAKAIGSDAWFRCANRIDRVNRAIFYWNGFVAECAKKVQKK